MTEILKDQGPIFGLKFYLMAKLGHQTLQLQQRMEFVGFLVGSRLEELVLLINLMFLKEVPGVTIKFLREQSSRQA